MTNPIHHDGLLELILDSLGEGVVVADVNGKFLLFNPIAEKIMGLGALDEPPESWSAVYGLFYPDRETPVPPDRLPLVRALRGEPTDEMELFVRNAYVPDGVYVSVTGRPLRDKNLRLIGGVVIFHDITDKVRAVEGFKHDASRVLFELAKQDNPDLDSAFQRITEADARKLAVERVSIWLFNHDHGAIVCKNLYFLSRGAHEKGGELAAGHYPRYFRALEDSRTIDASDACADPRTSEFTEGYLKPHGIVSMMDVPIRLHGRVMGVVCHEHVGTPRRWTIEEQEFAASIADLVSIALEAAERRRVEKELEKNFSLLQATLESTADGILVVNESGRIDSYNQKFLEMWRVPAELASARDDDKAIAFVSGQLKDPETFLKKVRDLYAKPEAESFDALEFTDGRVFERYSKPQRVGGRSVGRVWSFRDVTARRRAEEGLREAYDELKKLNQIKTSFASMVSHELKTPLAAIQESVGVTMDGLDGALNAAQQKTLEIAKLNAEWLARLINNFLTFTTIESGRMEMRFHRLDARKLVEDACRLMKPAADKKGLKLAKYVPSEPIEVEWDSDRMKTVILNLIDNAVKYTDAPGHIRVRLAREGADVKIEVEDSGIGVRDQDKDTIFDMFSQAASQGPLRTGGFGIGLSICKYMAEHHGGSLALESEYGKGSRFIVRIPAVPTEDIR